MHDIIKNGLNKDIELEIRTRKLITVYKSKIHSILPNKIIVTAPIGNQAATHIKFGTRLKLLIMEINALITFDAQVDRSHSKGPLSLLTLNLLEQEVQTQKRESYRVPTEQFPINVKIPSLNRKEESNGICIELSGGGMMSTIDRQLPSEGIVGLSFKLPENPRLYSIIGEIKRVSHVRRLIKTEYRTAFHFCILPAKVHDNIVKHIFKQQQKLIRSGLISN